MGLRSWFARETYVAIHAQSWRFRVVKYIILLAIIIGLHAWGGWGLVGKVFAVLFVVALAMHFFYRWKTKAWTRSWGGYKKLDLPK